MSTADFHPAPRSRRSPAPASRWCVALAAALLGWGAPAAAHTPPAGSGHAPASLPGSASLSDTGRVRRWSEDLRYITGQVRRRHPRPFAFSSESAFDSAARSIERSIPRLDDAHLALECMRMVAALGDGHTLVVGSLPQLGFETVLPMRIQSFEDGLYVVAADSALAAAVGCRVTRIGDLAAEEALARVGAIIPADNRYTRLDRSSLFLMMPGVLHALGAGAERDRVTLEIERSPGKRERVVVAGGPPPAGFPEEFMETEPRLPGAWKSARRAGGDRLPRCDRRPEEAWWFEYLPEARALYLRMRRIEILSGDLAYFELYRRLFAAADSLKPQALIVDLRHDHGGSNTILDPLIRGIVERPWLNREGSLYALVDRGTFSAAMNAAVFLEDWTRAVFVGEPTGGRPNHYGDGAESRTPNLGMIFQVSTLPWFSRYPEDERPWIAPAIATPATFASWREGRDLELEAALDAVRNGTLCRRVLAAARRAGGKAGRAAYDDWIREHPNPWGGRPFLDLQRFCDELMDRGEWSEAALVGETLVQVDPASALGWRLLGEAQAGAGNRSRAVESLRETMRLSPRARIAPMMLRRLGEAP